MGSAGAQGRRPRLQHVDDRRSLRRSTRADPRARRRGRRVLELAAREADIVGLNVNLRAGKIDASSGPNATLAATDEKVAWTCDAAGARFDDLELQVRVHVAAVTNDRHAMAELLAPAL